MVALVRSWQDLAKILASIPMHLGKRAKIRVTGLVHIFRVLLPEVYTEAYDRQAFPCIQILHVTVIIGSFRDQSSCTRILLWSCVIFFAFPSVPCSPSHLFRIDSPIPFSKSSTMVHALSQCLAFDFTFSRNRSINIIHSSGIPSHVPPYFMCSFLVSLAVNSGS